MNTRVRQTRTRGASAIYFLGGNEMKKIIAIALAAAMVFALCACGSSSSAPAAGSSSSAIQLTCGQLFADSNALGWVDVCKAWQDGAAAPSQQQ